MTQDGTYLWRDTQDTQRINFGEFRCGRMFSHFSIPRNNLSNMFSIGCLRRTGESIEEYIERADKFDKIIDNVSPGELIKANLMIEVC